MIKRVSLEPSTVNWITRFGKKLCAESYDAISDGSRIVYSSIMHTKHAICMVNDDSFGTKGEATYDTIVQL